MTPPAGVARPHVGSGIAAAYSAAAEAWQDGPSRVYDRLADVLAEHCPVSLAGGRVIDVGAGTGAATRAAERRGGRVVAVDVALGMLRVGAAGRPPAAVGDAVALPFATGTFDAVIAAFSLNHIPDPTAGLREAARVLRPGGGLVVGAYAADDSHPVKAAVEAAVTARGWRQPAWWDAVRTDAVPRLATVERAEAAAVEAGLTGARAALVRVPFPDLTPADMVAWRLGMAQTAGFVGALPPAERTALAAEAESLLGADPSPLVRSLIVLTWRSVEEAGSQGAGAGGGRPALGLGPPGVDAEGVGEGGDGGPAVEHGTSA